MTLTSRGQNSQSYFFLFFQEMSLRLGLHTFFAMSELQVRRKRT